MKTIAVALFCFLTLVVGKSDSQTTSWQWAVGAGTGTYHQDQLGGEDTQGDKVAVDKAGNIYVIGGFTDSIVFPLSNITLQGRGRSFLSKYTADGKFLWAKILGGNQLHGFFSLCIDKENNVVMAGTVDSATVFDSIPVVPQDSENIFIAKINGDGAVISFDQVAGIKTRAWHYDFAVAGLAIDSSDNIYITGSYTDSAYFGQSLLTTKADTLSAAYLAKFSGDVKLQWVSELHSSSDVGSVDVCIDRNGNPYITGGFYDTLAYREGQLTSKGEEDLYVAKYDNTGHLLLINTAGGTGVEEGVLVSTDKQGNIYVCGSFWTDTSFVKDTLFADTVRLVSAGSADFCVIKYSDDGTVIWAKRGGSDTYENPDWISGICIDTASNIFITGGLNNGIVTFDGSVLPTSHGWTDAFICKINSDGILQSSATEGGSLTDFADSIALDQFGNAYITGLCNPDHTPFGDIVMFGNHKIVSNGGNQNFFLAKYGVQSLSVPHELNAAQNEFTISPNPASSQATIYFSLDRLVPVNLDIYDLLGRQVKQISLGELNAGEHSQNIDLQSLPGGTYICRMQIGDDLHSEMMTVLK